MVTHQLQVERKGKLAGQRPTFYHCAMLGVVGEGECGDDVMRLLARDGQRLDISPAKKEAKLLVTEIPEVEKGKGEEDLRCRSLFMAYQRR